MQVNNLSKILSLKELELKSKKLKENGKKIVLCHGAFDVLHIGHLRYLDAAKKNGDILFVTITSDNYILKGPGRPVFKESYRSEMLSSLEVVDFVGIIEDESALPAIISIKPDFYVKGKEYKNHKDDVTGKIVSENDEVIKYNGKVIFTDEIVYSSSSLINKYFDPIETDLKKNIDKFKLKGGVKSLNKLLKKIEKLKILFIGDTIIDQYDYVNILGKSSKETIIATQHISSEFFAGGVIASAGHLLNFSKDIEIISTLGKGDPKNQIVNKVLDPSIKFHPVELSDRPTVRKKRMVDQSYYKKMFEVYFMDDTPLSADDRERIYNKVDKSIAEADLVIVNDFGHGMIFKELVELICKKSKYLALNTQTNSGNRGYNFINKYSKANYVVIDEPEFRLATQDKHTDLPDLASKKMSELINSEFFVITMGKKGCLGFNHNKLSSSMPALTNKVVDTVGAGDAFFSLTSPFAAVGADLDDLCLIGNIAGAMKVEILGHRKFLEKNKIIKYIETLLK